ncbi:MAG TPA: hexose kinase [Longimicrobiales bacterium]
MILTLTPNPSLDLLFQAETLEWNDANRVDAPRRRPGGQGINVARAARALGGAARAVAPLGGLAGHELARALRREGTPLRAVPISDETRVFVGVHVAGARRDLLLNPRGPRLVDDEGTRLLAAIFDEIDATRPAWVACCGSLARGLPDDLYARVGRHARDRGARFVPDCDVPPLRLAAEAGCDLLVPNTFEAGRLLGRPVDGIADAARAASALLRFGAELAVVTLGPDGAVAAHRDDAWIARPPRIDGRTAVGAGDALLAAILLALQRGAAPPDALRAAVAAGTATLLSHGDALVDPDDVDAITPEVTLERAR